MIDNPYLAIPRIKAALRSLDLRPTRGMGQNFLTDPTTLQTIVGAGQLTGTETVLEVGPGLGVLTWELLQQAGHVISVELDKRLIDRLRAEFADAPNLTLIQGDILNLPPLTLLQEAAVTHPALLERPYQVIANLPYAVTSPVLRHFLETSHPPRSMVVLVQWEVAQRIAAQPGDLSVLAHAIQIYAEPTILLKVPGSHFHPAPAVDSAVLHLLVRPQPAAQVDDIEALMRIIKAGFLHARKTLSNALPSGLAAMGRPTTRDQALAALASVGIDPQRRAETLSLDEWVGVYRALG